MSPPSSWDSNRTLKYCHLCGKWHGRCCYYWLSLCCWTVSWCRSFSLQLSSRPRPRLLGGRSYMSLEAQCQMRWTLTTRQDPAPLVLYRSYHGCLDKTWGSLATGLYLWQEDFRVKLKKNYKTKMDISSSALTIAAIVILGSCRKKIGVK